MEIKIRSRNNIIKKKAGDRCFDFVNCLIMLAITVVMLYPMLYVVFASFSDATAFMKSSGLLYKPAGFSLEAYKLALGYPMLLRGYINTVFIIFFGVIIGIILTSIGAYGLTRKNVKLQQFLNISIIITMFFSGGMIPFYITVKDLGLTDNIWSLILPSAVSTFNLMILKVSFASIPDGLTESATIDGAGHFTLLFRIIMPVSKATLAVLVLYYAVGHWNSWFNAMMFIDDRNKYPLQLVLREVLITSDTSSMTAGTSDQEFIGETIKHAVIVISTVPILCVYPFLQKYFTKGVMIGSVKG